MSVCCLVQHCWLELWIYYLGHMFSGQDAAGTDLAPATSAKSRCDYSDAMRCEASVTANRSMVSTHAVTCFYTPESASTGQLQ